jgi:hypothetical protein
VDERAPDVLPGCAAFAPDDGAGVTCDFLASRDVCEVLALRFLLVECFEALPLEPAAFAPGDDVPELPALDVSPEEPDGLADWAGVAAVRSTSASALPNVRSDAVIISSRTSPRAWYLAQGLPMSPSMPRSVKAPRATLQPMPVIFTQVDRAMKRRVAVDARGAHHRVDRPHVRSKFRAHACARTHIWC